MSRKESRGENLLIIAWFFVVIIPPIWYWTGDLRLTFAFIIEAAAFFIPGFILHYASLPSAPKAEAQK